MQKIIIQIPCLNEEEHLPITTKSLPRTFPKFPNLKVEWLIIDDGSTDKTVEVAKDLGFDHIISHTSNQGLAEAWKTGLKNCLELGADYIVNVDADNQYSLDNLEDLITPVVKGESDLSIGCRDFFNIPYFSKFKSCLQIIGTKTVSLFSGVKLKDATSGYRALNRKAAASFNVFSSYTYTLETILQAGYLKLKVSNVPVGINPQLRKSRLLKSNFSYVKRSAITILQVFLLYNPLLSFSFLSLLFMIPAFLLGVRFLIHYITMPSTGIIQSLILCSVLALTSVQLFVLGLIAQVISFNRRLLEELRIEQRLRKWHIT